MAGKRHALLRKLFEDKAKKAKDEYEKALNEWKQKGGKENVEKPKRPRRRPRRRLRSSSRTSGCQLLLLYALALYSIYMMSFSVIYCLSSRGSHTFLHLVCCVVIAL